MDSSIAFGVALGFLILVLLVFFGFFYWMSKGLRKQIEEALKNATEEEQTEIRKKIVKAMFPPRFTRD